MPDNILNYIAKSEEILFNDQYIECIGNDPNITLSLKLKKGWHKLSFTLQSSIDSYSKLYLKYNNQYDENCAAHIPLDQGINSGTMFFYVKEDINEVRFDPINGQGILWHQKLSIKPLSKLEYLFHRVYYYYQVTRQTLAYEHASFQKVLSENVPFYLPQYNHCQSHYQQWINKFEKSELAAFNDESQANITDTKFSILISTKDTSDRLLKRSIKSVLQQEYKDWEISIAGDKSAGFNVQRLVKRYAKQYANIKYSFEKKNLTSASILNLALENTDGDWIINLRPGDTLDRQCLCEIAKSSQGEPSRKIIYSDHDYLDSDSQRMHPQFKPQWNHELFHSMNYIGDAVFIRHTAIQEIRAYRDGFKEAENYDLLLRIIENLSNPSEEIYRIPKILYHSKVLPIEELDETELSSRIKSYVFIESGRKALEESLQRRQIKGKVSTIGQLPYYRTEYALPEVQPLVSLIIPTKDNLNFLQGVIESILEKTTYSNYEILIINNRSEEPGALQYLKNVSNNAKVRIIDFNQEFNYSRINNFAVQHARGEIIGLINNDVEVISPEWLTEMVSHVMQDGVGCVGAKLYYDDKKIQHAGVIVGLGDAAGHAHRYYKSDDLGYMGRLQVCQEFSAVTAACLLIKKALYQKVGGLNEEKLSIAYNDVDLCLKVVKAGYRNVFTPFAELYHYESKSRGFDDNAEKRARYLLEVNYMQKKWQEFIQDDPCYSPNLTKLHENFSPHI